MLNVQLFDKSFRPDASTVRGRSPRYWTYLNSIYSTIKSDIEVFTHGEIFQDSVLKSKTGSDRRYGMAWESAAIVPDLYKALAANTTILRQHYKHIFTYHPELLKLDPELFKYAPAYGHWMNTEYGGPGLNDIEEINKVKTAGCSLVVSDKNMAGGHALRNLCAQRYGPCGLDLFGAGVGKPFAKSSNVILPYRFHLAIENHSMENYITEKVLNCFAAGTIPIYWGASNLSKHFNPDGFIRFEDFVDALRDGKRLTDFLTPNLYQSKIKAVEDNFGRAAGWAKPIEDYIHEHYFSDGVNG